MKSMLLIISIIGLLFIGKNVAALDCPCTDVSYCNRVTAAERKEVVGYAVKLKYFESYDWEKLTTVIIYEQQMEEYGMDLVCLAHKYQTRVLLAVAITHDQLKNATGRSDIVRRSFNIAETFFMDGANIDVEMSTMELDLRYGLTEFALEMKAKFSASYPHSMVIADVFWLPNIYHDTWGLANAVDFLFIMSYDEQEDMLPPCVARANAPLAQTEAGVAAFRLIGIPGNKLVVGLPWYGYLYDCTKLTDQNLCFIEKMNGTHCTQRIGVEIDYQALLKMLPYSMGGRQWSSVYDSPFFNYKDNRTGAIKQVWYDDPMSLQPKYGLANKYGLRGVGIWQLASLDYTNSSNPATKSMWEALPSYK